MKLDKYVAVSGLPGIFKVVANKNNGLIIEDLESGRVKFASSRQYQFTPLSSIGIFTNGEEDSVEIESVFKTMIEKSDEIPVVSPSAGKEEMMDYFAKILPTYDRERVFHSHVKKVIKWFTYLNERDLLKEEEEENNQQESEEGKEEQ